MNEDNAREFFRQIGMCAAVVEDFIRMFKLIPEVPVESDRMRVYREFNFEPTSLESMMSTIAGALV
jgi:hypothetical protein